MLTPLVHITMPDDDGEDRHFAPVVIALDFMCKLNEWHIRRSLKRAAKGEGNPIVPLYASGVRYKEDPPGEENWGDLFYVLACGYGDCLPLSTLVLRDDYELVSMCSLRPGERIMGDGAWTMVRESIVTGEKQILAFRLSNGCVLRCSPEHRLFRDVDGRIEEIRASEARIGDDLLTPRLIPLAASDAIGWPDALARLSEADRAWLLGAFVADGWTDGNPGYPVGRASISGRDGKPKEQQKRRVEQLMASAGVETRWHAKYIAINDREVARFLDKCGHPAVNKHLDSLRFASEASVRAVLEGLSADASFETREGKSPCTVYGTTSPKLALQLRVLYRMLGVSTSIRFVRDHGGLGDNPVYRITPRLLTREGYAERREKKFARVRSIEDGGVELCGDVTTESGRFWLPESDVLVHNCDRLVAWRVGELRAAGIKAEPVVKWQQIPKEIAVGALGYPGNIIPAQGLSMIHCCVRFPDGHIEDPSKILGMGGEYTSKL